jgi:hypothetical protein
MTKITKTVILIVLSFYSLTNSAQDGQRRVGAPTIDQAREILSRGSSTEAVGTINLQGLNYYRELEIGHDFRVIAVSKNLAGGLILFSQDGLMTNSLATDEITSIQVFDLNDDGVSEIVTEEVEARGTGILIKNFKLYAVDSSGIRQLWQRRSYTRQSPLNSRRSTQEVHETQYFIRFDPSGAGSPSRITYLEPLNQSGQFRKTEYVMTGTTIRQASEIESRR